jgi:thioredoxin reductase
MSENIEKIKCLITGFVSAGYTPVIYAVRADMKLVMCEHPT